MPRPRARARGHFPPNFGHKSGTYTTHRTAAPPPAAEIRPKRDGTAFELLPTADVMAERPVQGNFMRSDKLATAGPQPQTRNELQAWVHDRLALEPALETALVTAIDAVFT